MYLVVECSMYNVQCTLYYVHPLCSQDFPRRLGCPKGSGPISWSVGMYIVHWTLYNQINLSSWQCTVTKLSNWTWVGIAIGIFLRLGESKPLQQSIPLDFQIPSSDQISTCFSNISNPEDSAGPNTCYIYSCHSVVLLYLLHLSHSLYASARQTRQLNCNSIFLTPTTPTFNDYDQIDLPIVFCLCTLPLTEKN